MTKDELRQQIRRQFQGYSNLELSSFSLSLQNMLASHDRLRAAKTIMAYCPLKDEIDIMPYLNKALQEGKTILLPEVIGKEEMTLRIYDQTTPLQKSVLGTRVPEGSIFCDYNKIDVVLVPGMAFSHDGHRMGRGRGYYDRFLAQLTHTYKIGVCFPFQFKDTIPYQQHDICMDEVLTAKC